MSSTPSPPGYATPVEDPEKGTLDPSQNQLSLVKFDISKDEKSDSAKVTTTVVPAEPATPIKLPAAKPAPKPKKTVSRWIIWKLWFNTYRKLFTFTFTLNMIGLGLAAGGVWQYGLKYNGAIALANINFAILMRNEIFGRLLYLFVNTFFAKWTPLKFRLGCTSVLQHLGGIHSGCATSGIIWILLKVVRNFVNRDVQPDAVLALGVLTNVALVVTAMAAFPWVRNTHHNAFERPHRFVGWTGIILTWIFSILGDLWDEETQTWNTSGRHVVRQQDFWFVMGMTLFTVTPWICTRHAEVDIELPSPKVAVLRFKRGMQQGLLARVSRSAVKEYHAFGIISEGTHAKYHYLICGVQGDFTRSLVNDPPKRIWTRELKFAGVSNTSTLYKRGIRICTGTGLGAALSTCIQSPNWYLIWIGSDQEKTFGPTIAGLIHRHLEGRVLLWDSKQRGGRPDSVKILKEVYESWQAEVVFITSNYQGNEEIMRGCTEAGIPVFGTLWDF